MAHGARRVCKSDLKTIPFSSILDEYCHAIQSLLFDRDGLGSVKATKRLIDVIKEINPDVVQIHNLHGYYINYKLLFEYLNSTDIPVVMTLHDCWAFTRHCVHFVTVGCEKWKYGCYDCELKAIYPKRTLLFDRSKRNFERKKSIIASNPNLHIVTVSEWLGNMARQSLLKDRDIRVISNGVDTSLFKPMHRKYSKAFTIVAVANVWHKEKGFYDILELSKMLRKDERIIMVGGLSERLKYRITPNILYYGMISNQEELAEVYNSSDVVVSMSYAETFGLTIVEGAACGKPAVVYDNTAQSDLVTPLTGILVKTGDVSGVYDAIEKVRNNGRDYYMTACRKMVEESFDKEKCFDEYVMLCEVLIHQ